MDYDSFLGTPRWDILQILAERPSSPIEIAQKLKTTVSYSSQQLKLLNAAGIVSKKRTGAFERGKPRNLFSLSNEICHLSLLTNGFSDKRLLTLNKEHKAILKFWAYYPVKFHNSLQRLFWGINEFKEDYSILIEKSSKDLFFVCESKRVKDRFHSLVKDFPKDMRFKVLEKIDKLDSQRFDLVYSNSHELKGGEEKDNE